MKESIAMGSIGLLLGFGLNSIAQNNRSKGQSVERHALCSMRSALCALRFVVSLLCIWLIWKLKYYYLAVLMPLFLSYLIIELASKKVKYLKEKFAYFNFSFFPFSLPALKLRQAGIFRFPSTIKILAFCICVIFLSFLATRMHWNLHLTRVFDIIVDNYYKTFDISNACIAFENLQPTVKSFLQNSPKALFSALFRPGIWEADNILQIFAGLENLVGLLLVVLAIYNFVRKGNNAFGLMEICFLLYTIVLAIFLAFSCPNFGTLVRYRVGFYPFFVYLVLMNVPFKYTKDNT